MKRVSIAVLALLLASGCSSSSSSPVVNIAHIHTGAAGVAGPVLVNTTVNPGEVVLTGGAGSFTRADIT